MVGRFLGLAESLGAEIHHVVAVSAGDLVVGELGGTVLDATVVVLFADRHPAADFAGELENVIFHGLFEVLFDNPDDLGGDVVCVHVLDDIGVVEALFLAGIAAGAAGRLDHNVERGVALNQIARVVEGDVADLDRHHARLGGDLEGAVRAARLLGEEIADGVKVGLVARAGVALLLGKSDQLSKVHGVPFKAWCECNTLSGNYLGAHGAITRVRRPAESG